MNKDESGKYISELSEASDFFDRSAKKTMWIPKEFFDENKDYFGARAAGDGMTSAGINDGDLLIFEVADTLEDGEIGMFFYGKEHKSVCRIYKRYQSGAVYLLGNLKREPIRVDDDENFYIGGRLVGIYKAIQRKQSN